jgi:hypothetical protein
MVQALEKDENLVLGRRLLMEIIRSSGVGYLVSSTLNVRSSRVAQTSQRGTPRPTRPSISLGDKDDDMCMLSRFEVNSFP